MNKLSFQLVVIRHFDKGWFTGMGDDAWTFDWENSGDAYIPLSARVGRVFSIGKQKVNLWGSGDYNVGDDITGADEWGIKLNLTFLLPEH